MNLHDQAEERAERIPIERINPLHPPRDRAKLATIAADLVSNGWTGRPLLGELCADGYTVRLWTGSHRLAAAKRARCEDVPVYIIDTDALSDDYEPRNSDGLGECYRDAMPEDDAEIFRALSVSDPIAAALFAMDMEQ